VIELIIGTWRTYAEVDRRDLWPFRFTDDAIDVKSAAMVAVNPFTALRMLSDRSESIKKGHWIMQNGANSAVGQLVIQLARIFKLKTLNIIRDRYHRLFHC
jgi:mitochondrial enoyl-[acyl-carrier protein] reductase / trans-2-enoyl-CoA reductase